MARLARCSPGILIGAARNEERGNRELKRELLAWLSCRAMEVGAGTSLIPHYPVSVREVVAVEPEPYLRGRAVEAAAAAPVPVRVVDSRAAELPAADEEFDAGVISGLLCTVGNVPAALAEFARVLRPRGQLRFMGTCAAGTPRSPGFSKPPTWSGRT